MPYNPALPLPNSEIESAVLRDQFNGLKTLLDAVAAGAVTPTQLTTAINNALASAIAGTSSNSNAVATLEVTVSDPPTQAEVQTIVDKLNELINALRR